MEKKTPLYDWHVSHNGKIVPFGGFLLPVQYETGVISEHTAVRTQAGLFDVSHMGEFLISGAGALKTIQNLFTNDFTGMAAGRIRYTLMCNDNGGIVDDLIVYKISEESYLLVVNAANREKDAAWIQSRLSDAVFEDLSDSYGQIALQGPASPSILASVSGTVPQKYYSFIEKGKAAGIDCIISQSGYTGESGYELYCKTEDTVKLWEALLEAGKKDGLIPCGLGARDTLRFEAAMPLYGHEMSDTITPFEAGLHFAVKMNKSDFIGKAALAGKEKPSRIRVGLRVTGQGIIRENMEVFYKGENIGFTTSGTFCPYLKKAFAMALIKTEYSSQGTKIEANVRGRMIEAEIIALPFYTRSKT